MRLAFGGALALMVCACLAAGASAAPSVSLRVAFDPDLAGRRTTVELALRIGGQGQETSSPVSSVALRLPGNMGLAGTTLGQANCQAADLMKSGLKGCSGNARIGFGSASAVVPIGSQSVRERATLDILLGPSSEDRLEVLWFVQAAEPVFGRLVLPSVVEEAGPPYGEELATTVPLVQAWPEGPDLALETLDSSIGPKGLTYHRQVGGKTMAYHPYGMRVPRVCPPGGYPFGALLNFQDGTKATALYRVPCPRR
ncbi:MAG TPA: hypothetical protein VK672_07915 [Solirubrobacteraceae bacterium]|nr:hypothetical protein [Solirubrobacteraceae bacterium]